MQQYYYLQKSTKSPVYLRRQMLFHMFTRRKGHAVRLKPYQSAKEEVAVYYKAILDLKLDTDFIPFGMWKKKWMCMYSFRLHSMCLNPGGNAFKKKKSIRLQKQIFGSSYGKVMHVNSVQLAKVIHPSSCGVHILLAGKQLVIRC